MEDCLSWMYSKKDEVETGGYGWSLGTVEESLQQQRGLAKEIEEYKTELDKVTDKVGITPLNPGNLRE